MLRRKLLALFGLSAFGGGTGYAMAAPSKQLTVDDYLEIQQLYARYAHTVDLDPDGVAWANCFTPDGAHAETVGFDALVKYARGRSKRGLLDGTNVRHWNTNLLITPTAEGANGSCYLLLLTIGDKAHPPTLLSTLTYHDTLVKTAKGWRFKKREFPHEVVKPHV